MKILVFDTETSGLPEKNASIYEHSKWPYILQISYILYDMSSNNIIIKDNYIKIYNSIIISQESYEKHNLTHEILSNKGINIIPALKEFNEYLKTTPHKFEWVCYTKKSWKNPDFIINGKSVDLKTTFSDSMWIQDEKFDTYIYAQINKDKSKMEIKGWLSKKDIADMKRDNICDVVKRNNRIDYVFKQSIMKEFKVG